jgi:signal transduction histidine kinase/FixJ family two-component response regulator
MSSPLRAAEDNRLAQTLLIADNNIFYQQILGDFFREEGYEVAVASDGEEALERVVAGGIDLILLDLIMPRIDGARLCSFLKSHPEYSSIPVVILSGILADEIEGMESIRADAYVAKAPMEKLQTTLRKVFSALGDGNRVPAVEGFEGMFRREVVVEFLEERRIRDTILDSLAEGIVDLSEEGKILRTNRAFEEMVGCSAEELLSRPLKELFPASRQVLSVLFRDALRRDDGPSLALLRFQDRSLRFRLHPLAHDPAVAHTLDNIKEHAARENEKVRLGIMHNLPGFVLLVQDITEEVSAQKERDKFRDRMAKSERMTALGLFVAGAAHELNNPLTGVLGYAQLLAGRELDPPVRSALSKIEAGAARCKVIVDNLMMFSRRGECERRSESLGGILEEVTRECSGRAEASGVRVSTELVEPIPDVTVCRSEVVQALVAILDNAIRATLEGAEPREVTLRGSADCGSVSVEVTDSGPGIPHNLRSRIFDPFFTTRAVGEGKGLGLSVAFGVARAHGGTVIALDQSSGGACICFRIPCEGMLTDDSAGKKEGAHRVKGGRILVVDDEPVVQDLLADLLGEEYEVEIASNGREGLERAEQSSFDLIFLDIRMPDMSGRQMFEVLRATRPALADRVVFTTGDVAQEETRQFLDTIDQPCLAKPFSLDSVTEIVDRVIGAARSA